MTAKLFTGRALKNHSFFLLQKNFANVKTVKNLKRRDLVVSVDQRRRKKRKKDEPGKFFRQPIPN
jgi:hypothetical protein